MLGEIFGVDGIIVLIVVLVVLFGGTAIPKFARSLGSAKTEFEKGLREASQPTGSGDPTAGPAANGTANGAAGGTAGGTTASATVDDPTKPASS
ncbi:MAG: twin-arginine translocase TatA/TatE family subunit [Actinomycetota bacterium]|jgi:sec-independent protein translocase protein TatA|nr:twin-arginine translocase TatA/TatE family subunit [Actinomycetota bacterium]